MAALNHKDCVIGDKQMIMEDGEQYHEYLMSNITHPSDDVGDRYVGMSVSVLVDNKNEPIDGASMNDMYEEMIQSVGDDAMIVTDEEPRVSSVLLDEKNELQEVVVECKYRRGFCLVHNIKGDKMEVRTK